MMNATGVRWVMVFATASACLAAFALTPSSARPPAEAPVSVESLERRMPVGLLGVPLGTVVRVTGAALAPLSRAKADEGKTFLRIAAVNGRRLAHPVEFEFLRAASAVAKPAPGERFDYYAHEYGEFDGVVTPPAELGIGKPLLQHDGFHYRRHLTVHSSAPAPK